MTPRERQRIFRNKVKETMAWALMMSVPYLLLIDWLIIGY